MRNARIWLGWWLGEFRNGWRTGWEEVRQARAAYHATRDAARRATRERRDRPAPDRRTER